MPVGVQRDRVLHGLGEKRGRLHRYTVVRWALAIVLTAAVALLPATDALRIDLWSGAAWWLGERVDLVRGAKAFAFPFVAVNVLIVFASRFLGRYLCGFVCPIGNLNRLDEWLRWRFRKRAGNLRAGVGSLAACFSLAAITFSFWVDWAVFLAGSPLAKVLATGFLLGTTALLFGMVHGLGMRFCREYCPSGVYFALLGPKSLTGIEFAHPEQCTDCHACENVCPVDLEPRRMAQDPPRPGMGFYPDGLTAYANCLRCGDCVVVCEATTSRAAAPTPLALGFLSDRPPGEPGKDERA